MAIKSRALLRMLLVPAAVALAACSTQATTDTAGTAPAQAEGRHPVSGLEVTDLTVTSGGQVHRFRVEVAATPQDQARGLMFRTAMGADEGMIFPLQQVRMASFWMRNTVIPLDIIFIGPDNRILNIAAMTTPYSEEPIPSIAPAKAVLEINGGRAEQLGIAPGDLVEW
ncbi:DUF192 domain-containing protein [Altererythrobacter lauratis]|uniref:DUF192 domain-containing protein n=1 Tax=Alteraurantiacibacter lauratis TaxID=2054627 RepID=A0ABV7EE82_9SPHN